MHPSFLWLQEHTPLNGVAIASWLHKGTENLCGLCPGQTHSCRWVDGAGAGRAVRGSERGQSEASVGAADFKGQLARVQRKKAEVDSLVGWPDRPRHGAFTAAGREAATKDFLFC